MRSNKTAEQRIEINTSTNACSQMKYEKTDDLDLQTLESFSNFFEDFRKYSKKSFGHPYLKRTTDNAQSHYNRTKVIKINRKTAERSFQLPYDRFPGASKRVPEAALDL